MLSTELTRQWELRIPIVQAPMAGVSGGLLAGAVSSAGGLGMLGVGPATTPDWIATEAAVARSGGRFGIGLLLWALEHHPEQFDAALAQQPFVVALSFGDTAPYVARTQEAGVLVVARVQSAEAAGQAIEAGLDALVVQGSEAGGHTGTVGTLSLLQTVLDRFGDAGLPILAAGGLASGRAVAGVRAMGAAGAWVGTRFVATIEALGHADAKAAIVAARETDTVLTHVFDIVQDFAWPDAFPGRALRNDFASRWHGREGELEQALADIQPGFEAARLAADFREAHIYAGQAVGVIEDVPAAAELLHRLAADAETWLRRAPELVD